MTCNHNFRIKRYKFLFPTTAPIPDRHCYHFHPLADKAKNLTDVIFTKEICRLAVVISKAFSFLIDRSR